MIQFELAMVYFATFCIKVRGAPWLQGTAMYYIYHLDEFRRFPVPAWLLGPTMLKLEGWAALVLEFSLGVLIWVKELRYILLALGVLFRPDPGFFTEHPDVPVGHFVSLHFVRRS